MEHGHEHGNEHEHGHSHGAGHYCEEGHARHPGLHRHRKAITTAFFITAAFMLVEAAGGLLTGSMALLSDSMHMLTDAAALANAMLLWLLSGYMLREVYARFRSPVPVLSGPMPAVAFVGLPANIACAWILHARSEENINMRGAFLHVVSDLAGSVAAIAAGAVIYFTGWYPADTIVSLLIIGLILFSSTRLLSEAFHILMEGAPVENSSCDICVH
jgi:cobalt-zinc-cadmium efflux system protein